jgi:hypothetical protein
MNAGQNMFEILAAAVGAGIPASQVGDMLRMMTATSFGAENQATTDAFVGAGGNYASTYSGSSADQNRQERHSVRGANVDMRNEDVRSGDRRYDTDTRTSLALEQDENKLVTVIRDGRPVQVRVRDLLPTDNAPMSKTDVQGMAALEDLPNATDAERRQFTGMAPGELTAWLDRATGETHLSEDGGRTIRNGGPMPGTAVPAPRVVSPDLAGAGQALDKINARTTEGQEINRQTFEAMLGGYETALRDNPTSSGMIGALRRFGQNAVQQYGQFQQMFPEQVAQIEASNQENLVMLEEAIQRDPGLDRDGILRDGILGAYDSSLGQLEVYANLLPFAAAAALAGQEGRSVTDRDVQIFRRVIGDATSFWGNQQDLLTKVATVREILGNQRAASQRIRQQGVDAVAPPTAGAADPGTVPEGIDPADWEYMTPEERALFQ